MDDLSKNVKGNELSLLDNCADGRYITDIKGHKVSRIGERVPTFKEQLRSMIPLVLIIAALSIAAFFFGKSSAPHASVDNSIKIGAITEKASLHVLSISDSVIVTENKEDNGKGITAWTKFTGTGEFIVDLQKSEFLVDQARKTVIVKTPEVSIDKNNFTLDYNDTKTLFFNNNLTDDDYTTGVGIAVSQLKEAYVKIYDQLYTNPYYYDSARNSAEKIIKSLVVNLNKGVEDLTVIVEVGALSE